MLLKKSLVLPLLLVALSLVLAACGTAATPTQQPLETEAPVSADVTPEPSPTPTPKPMQTITVSNDGDTVVLESGNQRFEITYHVRNGDTSPDATVKRFIVWSEDNVEEQSSSDTMPCNMIAWMSGPYIAPLLGLEYTSACYAHYLAKPDTFVVKVYEDRMDVMYTDMFQEVK